MKPTPGRRSPCPVCLSHPFSTAIHVSATHTHTHAQIYKLGHMLSSWELAVLPGNQGAPIIAVYYSSHFPDSHIKQPSNPYNPAGSGQHAHLDPPGLVVELGEVAGSPDNQAWTLSVVREGYLMSQIWLETHPDKSYCYLWSASDRQAGNRGRRDEETKEEKYV